MITLPGIILWLEAHRHISYLAIFAGSYFETLIGPSFFIPGELVFIPGAILGGIDALNIWYVVLACYAGGILGDSSSYFIGRKAGNWLLSRLSHKRLLFNEKNYHRGEAFFKRYGPKAIFLARIGGPFSWVTPFLAGMHKVPYRTFYAYNIPGVIVGIGWFLALGYFFSNRYKSILIFMKDFFLIVLLVLVFAGFAWWALNKYIFKQKISE